VRVAVYYRPGLAHQERWTAAFCEGLKQHGIQPEHLPTTKWKQSDVAVVWGERLRQIAETYTDNTLVIECGYFRDRLSYASLGWNGLNNRADFCNKNSPPDRWQKHGVPVRDWKEGGEYVLILGQVPGDYSHRHADINAFYSDAIRGLSHIGLPVVFRPHPLSRGTVKGCILDTSESLEAALDSAALAVTFNSNSGVDAVLRGVPTITMDKGAMAWDVTGHTYETPPTPDREQWLNDLAYCQWTEQELREGAAWQHLSKGLNA